MNYKNLCALAALNEKYAAGEIDRAEYDRLHGALAKPPSRAARFTKMLDGMADEIVKAIKERIAAEVAAAEARHGAEIAQLKARIEVLERALEARTGTLHVVPEKRLHS